MQEPSEAILKWFDHNGRRFPWREERDPFHILLVEIMLQRTRAAQVQRIYRSILASYPTPDALSLATQQQIEDAFRPLGLRWRAGLVRALAKDLVMSFNGRVPESRRELLSLPGVGDYMADAVLSFAYGRDVAVLDANVSRVIARYHGIVPRGEARRDQQIRVALDSMLPTTRSREFNWGMIDIGATICTVRRPSCQRCPLKTTCRFAGANR